MANNEIRIPKQKRSVAKRNAIIQASFDLFCERGYYKTNTAEIAKGARVSTGIVYSYFHDKKDILIEVVKLYVSQLEKRFVEIIPSEIDVDNIPILIKDFLDLSIASHMMNRSAHDEFLALALLESDIDTIFSDFENRLLSLLYKKFEEKGYEKNLLPKLRIAYGIVEQVCHDYVQGKITDEELKISKQLAISTIILLLK